MLLLTAAGCSAPGAGAHDMLSGPPPPAGDPLAAVPAATRGKASEAAWQALATGEPQDLILELDVEVVTSMALGKPVGMPATAEEVAQRAVLYAAAKHDVFAALPLSFYNVLVDYNQLPLAFVRVTGVDGAAAILADRRVARLHDNQRFDHQDAKSFQLIHQPEAAADGADGSGTAIAILDTGCDYTKGDFGSCTGPAAPASCRVVYAADIAPDDHSLDDSGHGTNVAAIALGVAPQTRIIALDVFNGPYAYSSDLLTAINWVVTNQHTYNIVALNMSLGGGRFDHPCKGTAYQSAFDTVRAAGVLATVAAGNDGSSSSLAQPACVPGVLAVGAVYSGSFGGRTWDTGCTDSSSAADQVTCFSNSAPFLSLLAPGAMISAAGLVYGGTSQAAPHVAGAIAALRGAFPTEPLDSIANRLLTSGPRIVDPRNQVGKYRLDLAAAAAGCVFVASTGAANLDANGGTFNLTLATGKSCNWSVTSSAPWLTLPGVTSGVGSATIPFSAAANGGPLRSAALTVSGDAAARAVTITEGVDNTPPTGTVIINGGKSATRTTTVALTIDASDPSGVAQMCISATASCITYVPYASSKTFTLPAGDGKKTVYVFLKDGRGNTSTAANAPTASILLDTVAPRDGSVSGVGSHAQVQLSWAGFSDAGSGMGGYLIVASSSAMPTPGCASDKPIYSGADLQFSHLGLVDGTLWYYRLCGVDVAGNVSAGITATLMPKPESNPPVGGIAINGGAQWTSKLAVTIANNVTDDTAVARMCFSTNKACVFWEKFAPTKSYNLPAGEGAKVVYAWFADVWGNAMPEPVTATIKLDTIAPTGGAATIVGGDRQLTLSWSGFTDGGSGVAGYRAVYSSTAVAPASCAVGLNAYSGSDVGFTHTLLTNGTTYSYRVCAIDAAGNLSKGVTVSAYPAPEYDPPTNGSVVINGGAPLTNSLTVVLTLSATDASGVAKMCVSATPTCTTWEPFAGTRKFALQNAQGSRTIYAWFRDPWGNTTPLPTTASIVLDNQPPTPSVVTATPGSQQIALAWTAASDPGSGVAGYTLVVAPGAQPPPSGCRSGTVVYKGADLSFTHAGLVGGSVYSYRLCATDNAGNTNLGAVKSATAGK